jgi:transcriptional regulator with XRE-family HTH domain
MDDRDTTVRSRELGDALRKALREAGLTGADMARKMRWSDSKVSRLLSGKRGAKPTDVAAFLAVCGVTGTDLERLLKLCEEMEVPGWLQQHGPHLPKQLRTLMDHEDTMSRNAQLEIILIPGMVQTPDYTRAVMVGEGLLPGGEIEARVKARLARQSILSRDRPAEFVFYIHEFACRLPVGGPTVMSDQLHQLLRLSVRPHITIRVIPAAQGAFPGMTAAFQLMEFAEHRPVSYLEGHTTALFLEEPPEIATYRRAAQLLAGIALNEGQSRDMIAMLATELYAAEPYPLPSSPTPEDQP